MAIQWFPGHMHKARKALSEIMKLAKQRRAEITTEKAEGEGDK